MDEKFMLAALAQSRKALPECLPNPPVGCVIVHSGEIVAVGYTYSPGKHHAEADALTHIQECVRWRSVKTPAFKKYMSR